MNDTIVVCIDANCKLIQPVNSYVNKIIEMIFENGLTDSSNITDIKIVSENDIHITVEIQYELVRGIGYTPVLERLLSNFFTPIIKKLIDIDNREKLKDAVKEGPDHEKYTNTSEISLNKIQQVIDKSISHGRYDEAKQLLEIYSIYKSEILGIS